MAQPSTLLSIIQRASDELSLARPSAAYSSSDPTVRKLVALLQEEGRFLMKNYEWSVLRTLYTFSTANGTATYAVPVNFDRMIADTFWDRTNYRKVRGPDVPAIDRWREESTTGQATIRKNYRQIGSNIQIFPTPTAIESMVYEYISDRWAQSNASVAQTEFFADTDSALYDPYLMIKGLKWRWLSANGLDAQVARMEYDNYLDSCKGSDNTGETLNMAGDLGERFISMDNVPDTGFAV